MPLEPTLHSSALQAVLSCKAKGAAEVESHTTDLTSASAIDQLVSTLLQRHKVRRKLFTGNRDSRRITRCTRSFGCDSYCCKTVIWGRP